MNNCQKEYALYHGDEFIDLGTADELAERLNLKRSTILFYACSKRIKERDKRNKSYIAIVIEDD